MSYFKKSGYFTLTLFLILAVFHYVISGLAGAESKPAAADNAAGALNTLSKYSIRHSQDNDFFTVTITGPKAEDLSVSADDSVITIRDRGSERNPGSVQSFPLPVAVDGGAAREDKKPGELTVKIPILKRDGKTAPKSSAAGGRKWYFNDRDLEDLFDFKVPAISDERDVNIRKFFEEDEMFPFDKYFDEVMKVRAKMHRELKGIHKNMPKGVNTFSRYNVTHNVENGNIVVKITGDDLSNVTVKVENNVMMIENRNENKSTEKDENSYSSQQFYSSFAQSFTLPANVDGVKMKVERKSPGEILVTVPLAGGQKPDDKQGILGAPDPGAGGQIKGSY